MTAPTTEILTIQKFVFLLDDFHYHEFLNYLVERNLKLSIRLTEEIRIYLPKFESADALCKKIYGEKNKASKLKFNQLASHTFRQSSHLAINYPYYLSPNFTLLAQTVNKGETEKTELLSDALLDIARRIEDRPTQLLVLKFLTQRAFLMKRNSEGVKYMAEIKEVRVTEMCFDEILTTLRIEINANSGPTHDAKQLQSFETMFLAYCKHESKAVRLLAQYAYIYLLFYSDKNRFYDLSTRELMNNLDKDIERYQYIILPFGFDIKSSFTFYKLNSPFANLNSPDGKLDFADLLTHYKSVQFWNSYLNIPELFTIATKTSYYLTQYSHFVYRRDYNKLVKPADLTEIGKIAARCQEMLAGHGNKSDFKSDLINLTLLRAGLLILLGGDNTRLAAEELELMLTSFQQHNFGGATDTIYLFLMLAYFSMKQYDKCKTTYNRYSKSFSTKTFSKSNDIDIQLYFYASQWLKSNSKQYLHKLNATYKRTLEPDAVPGHNKRVLYFFNYFNIPIE